MRIVAVNTHDRAGGAARVALGLHDGLRAGGDQSLLLVKYRAGREPGVVDWDGRLNAALREVTSRVEKRVSLQALLDPSWFDARRAPLREADVVQLHNIHGGYFNPLLLGPLGRRSHVVWTLHDMWGLTGKCVHAYGCERWVAGCGACPLLSEYPALRRDTTGAQWRLKRAIYGHARFVVVTPSTWLARLVERSILQEHDVRYIPNGVDTAAFSPGEKEAARRELGLPADRSLVLFVAAGGHRNPHKGFALLSRALGGLGERRPVLVVLGGDGTLSQEEAGCEVIDGGRVDETERLALYYRAVDVLAFPSLAENCPLAVLEAMACGRPVVAFAVGGIPDLVDHLETGYLARLGDAGDLARGLAAALDAEGKAADWGAAARARVEERFDLESQIDAYRELYREIAGEAA
jgi:glycosyltransferase involved in cell wall biosynthesis